jgi:hypothetical protein
MDMNLIVNDSTGWIWGDHPVIDHAHYVADLAALGPQTGLVVIIDAAQRKLDIHHRLSELVAQALMGASAHNRYRAVGMRYDVLADRTEEHPHKAISATGPDNDQVSSLRPLNQYLGWAALLDRCLDFNRRFPDIELTDGLLKHCHGVVGWLSVVALGRQRPVWRLMRQHRSTPCRENGQ